MNNPEELSSNNLHRSYSELGRIPVMGERAVVVNLVLEDERILESTKLWDDITIGTRGLLTGIGMYHGLEVAWFDADLEEDERIPKSSPFTFREIAPVDVSDGEPT